MLSTHLTAVLALASLSTASAIAKPKREASFLKLSVVTFETPNCTAGQYCPITPPTKRNVDKRQIDVTVANVQSGTRYFIDFAIGSTSQPVTVALDTGSSDTWVNPTCANAGTTANVALCNTLPRFNKALSTTIQDTGDVMSLAYGLGDAQGEYYKDDILLGGATLTAQEFGIASNSDDMASGLMGVGPGIELTGYPTIIDSLASQGLTQSRAFSLDLRGVDSPSGSIIFGGIDTGKFIGALEKRPIIPAASAPDGFDRYWIYLTSVGITKPGAAPKTYPLPSNPAGQPVFLDSGGTLCQLPTDIFNDIVADLNGTPVPSDNSLYSVDCSLTATTGTVDFTFGSTVINVPYNEFIWQPPVTAGSAPICIIGAIANDDAPVLGDSFLRAAYVVYDQDNQNLLVAPAADCGETLIAISSGPDAVPSVTGSCGGSTSSSSTSSSSSPTGSSTSSSVSISTSTSSSSASVITSSSSSSSSSVPYSNGTHHTYPTYPTSTYSTVYGTTTYTTNGQVTTETKALYTTLCAVEATYTPAGYLAGGGQSAVYVTTTYEVSPGYTTTATYATYAVYTTAATYAHVKPTIIGGNTYPATTAGSSYPTTSSKAEYYTGAASKTVGGSGILIAAALAVMAML